VTIQNTLVGAVRKAALAPGLAAVLAAMPAFVSAQLPTAPNGKTVGQWREASLDDYRKHLMTLSTLVESCAKARDLKNCDPLLVGPDDRVPLSNGAKSEQRLVRYGWLRVLFSKAEEPDEPAAKPTRGAQSSSQPESAQPPPRTTSQLLQDAEKRLARDLVQAGSAKGTAPAHLAEFNILQQVLAGRDFSTLQQPSARDAMLEKVGNWLNQLMENASKLRATSAWVGWAVKWGFIVAVCVTLVWSLMQLERRWRVRLVPETRGPAAGAASARDWQLWLEDARKAAASGLWREAIHFVYWASISRLESRRLWPADRARTPREYLALVAPDDPRQPGLAQLTGSFERTWYGGRAAGERDYEYAEELARALITGGGIPGSASLSSAEGGRG